ncbi:hypothetical protein [Streptomyces acidicola]|uniref:hypothetical protein n=1 Tax=Streptomyces acidicola TaxID=2596892 RepID=UPI001883B479|nr:hypothetical protein [Streptomyces acidicola]
MQVVREQSAVDDCGEPGRGAGAVFVLAAGEGAEEFDQGVGGGVQVRVVGVGWGEGFPYGVADVGPGGGGEPVEVQAVVAGQAQAGDQQ